MNNPALPHSRNTDFKKLSRSVSLVENEISGYEQLLLDLPETSATVIGITGAPGAGKSSLTDALIGEIIKDHKKVAVICIDPSSPFNKGALLGDRIRMSHWYNHPDVFIRSLASRGALGGLHPRIIEISELISRSGFDYVIIETVGVGQSEVDIAGLADISVVVLIPEGGDVIQTMKAGLMEIADIFVINKADRPGADTFFNHLQKMLSQGWNNKACKIPVLKTIAHESKGADLLYQQIKTCKTDPDIDKQVWLMAQRAWTLIAQKKMEKTDLEKMKIEIKREMTEGTFNLYKFTRRFDEK